MRDDVNKRRKRRKRSEEEENVDRIADNERRVEMWVPKTITGKKVKNDEIKSLEEMFGRNYVMMEPEIFDALVANPLEKLVDFKKTTRVTRQGRNFSFRATVLVGELGNNVFDHNEGLWPTDIRGAIIIGQNYPQLKKIEVVIADPGVGFKRSLQLRDPNLTDY